MIRKGWPQTLSPEPPPPISGSLASRRMVEEEEASRGAWLDQAGSAQTAIPETQCRTRLLVQYSWILTSADLTDSSENGRSLSAPSVDKGSPEAVN